MRTGGGLMPHRPGNSRSLMRSRPAVWAAQDVTARSMSWKRQASGCRECVRSRGHQGPRRAARGRRRTIVIERMDNVGIVVDDLDAAVAFFTELGLEDRKSTRLNSSHPSISYAVFCLK